MRVAGLAALLCLSVVALSSSATPTNVPDSPAMAEVPRVHVGTPASMDGESLADDGSSDGAAAAVSASELPKVHLGIKPGHALHFDAPPPQAHVGTKPASRAFNPHSDSKSHRKRSCSSKRSMSKRRGLARAPTADADDDERLAGPPPPQAKQYRMEQRAVLSEKDQQYRQKLQRIEWAKQQAQHPPETYDEDGEHPLP